MSQHAHHEVVLSVAAEFVDKLLAHKEAVAVGGHSGAEIAFREPLGRVELEPEVRYQHTEERVLGEQNGIFDADDLVDRELHEGVATDISFGGE